MFAEVGVTAAAVGTVDGSRKLMLRMGGETAELFNFAVDKITGCDPSRVPTSKR